MLSAQTPAKVDFAKDVLPICGRTACACHGPAQQNSGMRVDRKSVVISRRGVVPGSSDNSFLFHRISGNAYGMQMPPTGPLHPEQIATIKNWIDQGAEWPDSLANEADLPPLNPKAVAMVDALHAGDLPAFMKSAAEDPKLLNARGPKAPRLSCTRCFIPARPRWSAAETRRRRQQAERRQRHGPHVGGRRSRENPSCSRPRRRCQRTLQRHAHSVHDRRAPSWQFRHRQIPPGSRRESQSQSASRRRIVASDRSRQRRRCRQRGVASRPWRGGQGRRRDGARDGLRRPVLEMRRASDRQGSRQAGCTPSHCRISRCSAIVNAVAPDARPRRGRQCGRSAGPHAADVRRRLRPASRSMWSNCSSNAAPISMPRTRTSRAAIPD